MRYFVLATLTALAFPPSTLEAASVPALKKETPYASARRALLAQGYRPVRSDGSGCRFGREDVCRAYPEAETCAGTGLGNCLLVWRRSRQLVEVMTVGEAARDLTVARVRCRSGCR